MDSPLENDLHRLCAQAFDRASSAEPVLRRYHAASASFSAADVPALTRLHEWSLVPISLWPFTNTVRGNRTIRSSGPQPAVIGSFARAASVMSMPMMAKSPSSSSQMSGQPSHAALLAPLECGSVPILRRKAICASIRKHIRPRAEQMQEENTVYILWRL